MSAQSLSPRLSAYFKDYAAYHKSPSNQVCHSIGIPAIVVSTIGLLATVSLSELPPTGAELLRFDGGVLLCAISLLWYFYVDWKITLPFTLCLAGFYFMGRALPVPALWGILVIGLVAQYLGHVAYEKNKPAFFTNLKHILIGPLWVFAKTIGYIR